MVEIQNIHDAALSKALKQRLDAVEASEAEDPIEWAALFEARGYTLTPDDLTQVVDIFKSHYQQSTNI